MIFDRNESKEVIALLGAGAMGCAIVRRVAAGRKVLFGDISEAALERVSGEFARGGYDVETCVVDALDTESVRAFLLGEHAGFITGTDLLIDGGTIAAIRTGRYTLGA